MTAAGSAVQTLLRLWMKFSDANRFDDATWQPRAAQEQKLLEIVRRNQRTAYGSKHGFDRIRSIEEFQQRVPPNTYETLQPFIEATLRGEPNQLTADQP